MTDADERCDLCGGLMTVLTTDYHDRCLDCRLGGMALFAEASR